MRKLVIVVVLIVMVLTSGCYEDLGYTECFPERPSVCISEGDDGSYLTVSGVTIPLIEDYRLYGEWYVDIIRDPILVIDEDNSLLYWDGEGQYSVGTYTWFAPSAIIMIVPALEGKTQLIVRMWGEGNNIIFVEQYQNGELIFAGVLTRGILGRPT